MMDASEFEKVMDQMASGSGSIDETSRRQAQEAREIARRVAGEMMRLQAQTPKRPNSIRKFFAYEHLPVKLQRVSKAIAEVAYAMDDALPDCAEKSAGLRKLLEAKDCFVRAELERALDEEIEKEG